MSSNPKCEDGSTVGVEEGVQVGNLGAALGADSIRDTLSGDAVPGEGTGPRLCSSHSLKRQRRGFPGGAVVESLPANAGDTCSSPGLGRSHMPRSN